MKDGVTEARWRQNDELRYALRSAEKFAPWVNHIYIVTSFGQVPDWLDTSNPKITLINQDDIMPEDSIPVFNSISVENCLINIPGLSEHFLFANDDMFFGRPIDPSFFFDEDGRIIVWAVKDKVKRTLPKRINSAYSGYHATLFYTAALFDNLFGKDWSAYAQSHNIEAYKISSIKEMLTHPIVDLCYQKSIRRKFRSPFQLYRWIFTLYDLTFKGAKLKRIRTKRSKKHFIYNFVHKINGNISSSPHYTINAKRDNIMTIRPPLFCINDTGENTDQDRIDNRDFLEEMFPDKSSFEK